MLCSILSFPLQEIENVAYEHSKSDPLAGRNAMYAKAKLVDADSDSDSDSDSDEEDPQTIDPGNSSVVTRRNPIALDGAEDETPSNHQRAPKDSPRGNDAATEVTLEADDEAIDLD